MDEAFAAWLLGEQPDLDLDLSEAVRDAVARLDGAGRRDHRDVAVLGFGLARTCPDASVGQFVSGLRWVADVTLEIDGTMYGAAADGVAILGLAVGARTAGADALAIAVPWLERVREVLPANFDPWHRALAEIGLATARSCESVDAVDADVLLAVADRCSVAVTKGAVEAALALIYEAAPDLEAVRCATRLGALKAVIARNGIGSVGTPTRDDLLAILRVVPRALQEWTWEDIAKTKGGTPRKWYVDNEYHVQNILWALLAPVFPGLRREEYVSVLGPKQPRADLGVPVLRTIIEAKFVRSNRKLSAVIDEIGTDASTYFVGQQTYEHLVAFVWDDGRRTEEHAEIRAALELLPRVVGAVVVARPGKMDGGSDTDPGQAATQ